MPPTQRAWKAIDQRPGDELADDPGDPRKADQPCGRPPRYSGVGHDRELVDGDGDRHGQDQESGDRYPPQFRASPGFDDGQSRKRALTGLTRRRLRAGRAAADIEQEQQRQRKGQAAPAEPHPGKGSAPAEGFDQVVGERRPDHLGERGSGHGEAQGQAASGDERGRYCGCPQGRRDHQRAQAEDHPQGDPLNERAVEQRERSDRQGRRDDSRKRQAAGAEAVDRDADERRKQQREHRRKRQPGRKLRPAPAELPFERAHEDTRRRGHERHEREADAGGEHQLPMSPPLLAGRELACQRRRRPLQDLRHTRRSQVTGCQAATSARV